MRTLRLPHTDLDLSTLVLGCMDLAGRWQRTAITAEHEAEARAFLETALELGANTFDHADIYAHGRAEELFGRLLKERPGLRDRIVLQSKCGIRFAGDPPGTPQRYDFSHDHLVEGVEGSLRRLGTDHLDVLLLHRPDALLRGEEIARAFERLKRDGKVRYFGVSNFDRFAMDHVQAFLPDPLVVNQLEMNLLHHGFAEVGVTFNQDVPRHGATHGWEGVLEYCRLKGVRLQAWRPLAKGLLSGLPLDGQPPPVQGTARLVEELSRAKGVSREAIVLAWLLRHPAEIQPVLGTIRPPRLRACAEALRVELSHAEWYALLEAARGRSVA